MADRQRRRDDKRRRIRRPHRRQASAPSPRPSGSRLAGTTRGDPAGYNPFLSYDFLTILEESGCAVPRTGWQGQHLRLEDADGALLGAVPCYAKSHSQGEYVFDHGWADAFERAGGSYYPKLQASVPFTPVTGPRLLVAKGRRRSGDQGRARRRAEGGDRAARRFLGARHLRAPSDDAAMLEGGRLPAAAPTSSSISSTRAMAATTISSTRSPRASARR